MYLHARVPNERGLLATYQEVCVYNTPFGIVCTRVSSHPIETYPKDYACFDITCKIMTNPSKPMTEDSDSISRLSSFRLLFSLGRKFTCAGTSRYRDRYAGVSGPEKSTLLWSNADSTVDARQWNHGMAGGIHTTQIEANSFIHFPYCALWLAQAVTVTCIYRLQV